MHSVERLEAEVIAALGLGAVKLAIRLAVPD
jgi:hypothetical protein